MVQAINQNIQPTTNINFASTRVIVFLISEIELHGDENQSRIEGVERVFFFKMLF